MECLVLPARLGFLALATACVAWSSAVSAKPLHKHKDFGVEPYPREVFPLTTLCTFEAKRDTKVAGTPVAAGTYIGGVCNSVKQVMVPAIYEGSVRRGAGGEVYWGKRIDNGLIDFIVENPKKLGAIAVKTEYEHAWSPLINGTSAEERSVFFAGVQQDDGTWWVDIIGADGESVGSIPQVTDITDYRSAYLVSAQHEFGKTHQVVSIDGELLTPLLPELTSQGGNWVFEVEDGLVMPVRPNGKIGRSNPRIQGYESLGPFDHSWAWASVWEMPDGSTMYGLVDASFNDMTGGEYLSLTLTDNEHGYPYVTGVRPGGSHSAYSLSAHYPPSGFAFASTKEGLLDEVEAFYQARIARDEARTKAWEAELAERKRRQEQAELAFYKRQQEANARRVAASSSGESGGSTNTPRKSCHQSYNERDSLTLDEAHWAMKHCYYTLSYPEWQAVDRVYMALQRGPPVEIAPAAPIYRSSVGPSQADLSLQRFNADLDRYMRGESSYDPTDTDW